MNDYFQLGRENESQNNVQGVIGVPTNFVSPAVAADCWPKNVFHCEHHIVR